MTSVCATKNFSILVTSPCLTDTLNISNTKFTSSVLTYNVKSAASVFSWTDSDATSAGLLTTTCGAFTWTVTKSDGQAIDSTFFTINLGTKTISTYTTDFTKVGTYFNLAKVCYTELGLTSVCDTKTFSIVVNNPCLTDTLTIDATKFVSPVMTYDVKSTASVFSWTDAYAASVGGYTAICGAFTWTVT